MASLGQDPGADLDPDLWQSLPNEVLELVLHRLPLEAIFRFRAVCKRWYDFPSSPTFRASCRHSTSQTPLLLAMRNVEDLRLAPILASNWTKWRDIDLSFLHRALLREHCDRITGIGSDGGLLCVCALNNISRSVIFVCNPLTQTCKLLPPIDTPWTVEFRQVIVRVDDNPSGHYRIFIFGSDRHFRRPGNGKALFLYSSRTDSVTTLPRVTSRLSRACGAMQGKLYYTLSRTHELITFDTESPDWTQTNTGIWMSDAADGYKLLVHGEQIFCAVAKRGNRSSRDDVVEFRIYELILATRQCVRLNINLQCLFVSTTSVAYSRYDWDFVVHRDCLLLIARSFVDDSRNSRWLDVYLGSDRFPSLAETFCTPRDKGRVPDSLVSRFWMSTLRLDLKQQVEFALT